jgi:hypothetical protein
MDLGVDSNLLEESPAPQRTVHLAAQHWEKIDFPSGAVLKADFQGIGPHNFESGHSMYRVV